MLYVSVSPPKDINLANSFTEISSSDLKCRHVQHYRVFFFFWKTNQIWTKLGTPTYATSCAMWTSNRFNITDENKIREKKKLERDNQESSLFFGTGIWSFIRRASMQTSLQLGFSKMAVTGAKLSLCWSKPTNIFIFSTQHCNGREREREGGGGRGREREREWERESERVRERESEREGESERERAKERYRW